MAALQPGQAHLLEEIWRMVASHMTVREWARASGTCIRMYRAEMGAVCVARCGVSPQRHAWSFERDLEWASKRWRRASVLHLQLHDGVVRRLPAVLANQPLAAGWLTELQVGRRVTGRGDSCDNASLLSHAPSLTMLAWRTHRLDDCTRMLMRMPCLTQLRHLVLLLEATCFGNDRMCISEAAKRNAKELTEGLRDSLVQLPALETLHLKQISCHHPESTGLNLRLPPLCLIACARLRYVCLDAFVAGSIGVPEGCSMSACFLAGSAALLQDAHWRRMLSQLRRIALSSSVWGGYHEDTKRLMEILQCCPLMRDLRLDLLSDADDQQHVFALDGSLAGLETLSVSAHKLMVFVPACARWRCIRLWCSGQLNVIFEDVGAFALHTKAFVFAGLHQHMENSASMASLCDALAARSVPKSISSFPGDPHIAALHSQHYTPENLQYEPACMCGACMRCLRRNGLIAGRLHGKFACGGVDLDDEALDLKQVYKTNK